MHELLAQGDFVRSLARQLIGGDHAEDLAQDAWVKALRRQSAVQHPRQWLARVLRRLAANFRRDAARRARREAAAAHAQQVEGPSTADVLACEEARQRVVAAVLALEEPFRGTVLARFYECLEGDQIAARHGIAVATVRSRLKRGLDQLRARLDAEHGGERAAWAAPLLLLGKGGSPLAFPILGGLMSMTKKLCLAAGLMLLAGLSVWTLWPEANSPAPGIATAVAQGAAGSVGADSGARQEDAQRRVEAGVGGASISGPSAPLPFPVVDEPVEEVPVRVLDAATRRPVAGAVVLYQPFRVDFEHPEVRGNGALQEANYSTDFLERFGSRTETAADGAAVIHLPHTGGRVIASHGDRSVDTRIDPEKLLPGERANLWLEDPRWIRLRVVDATSGAPMSDMMVEYSSRGSTLLPRSGSSGGLHGPSDADGMLRLPWRRDWDSLRVRPWITGRSEWVQLDLPAALDRVTELRCPTTGSLTIQLRTPTGQLWPTAIHATAEPAGGGDGAPQYGPVMWCGSEPGIFRVARVETGRTFRIRANPESPDNDAGFLGVTTAAGPTRAGEDVCVVLTTRIEPCILQARLQHADGSTLPGTRVHIRCEFGDFECYPDASGRVTWTVPVGSPNRGSITETDRRTGERLIGSWRLDVAATPGLHDLGTVTLAAPPVVVAGEFDLGHGAWGGATVKLRVEVPHRDDGWHHLQEITVPVGTAPAFAVHADTDAKTVRVSVLPSRQFAAPDPIVVPTGTTDLRLHLARGLPLRARVLAPAAYAQALSCRAVREDGAVLAPVAANDDDAPTRGEAALVDFDGESARFLWPSLPAGSYRVEVTAPGMDQPLVRVPAVRLGDDSPADPRLDPIDVRARTRTLTIRIVPLPGGARPITDGGVLAWPTGQHGAERFGMLFDARAEAQLLVGPGPVDVLVAVPGHRLWQAEAVTESSLQVAPEPCLQVRFRLSEHLAGRLRGYRVAVQLEPQETRTDARSPTVHFVRPGERAAAVQTSLTWLHRLAGTGEVTLDPGAAAVASVPVSAPGTFKLGVRLIGPTGDAWLTYSNPYPPHRVTPERVLVHGEDDPAFEIDAPLATIDRVTRDLERRR